MPPELQGQRGQPGQRAQREPQAQRVLAKPSVVTITPTAIDWGAGTATLQATLRVNGTITTPSAYSWTKGTSTTVIGTSSTLAVTDLNAAYNCTCTW